MSVTCPRHVPQAARDARLGFDASREGGLAGAPHPRHRARRPRHRRRRPALRHRRRPGPEAERGRLRVPRGACSEPSPSLLRACNAPSLPLPTGGPTRLVGYAAQGTHSCIKRAPARAAASAARVKLSLVQHTLARATASAVRGVGTRRASETPPPTHPQARPRRARRRCGRAAHRPRDGRVHDGRAGAADAWRRALSATRP